MYVYAFSLGLLVVVHGTFSSDNKVLSYPVTSREHVRSEKRIDNSEQQQNGKEKIKTGPKLREDVTCIRNFC